MSDTDPESQVLATRQAVQLWLLEYSDACEYPDDLTVLNLRVWAAVFLRRTKQGPGLSVAPALCPISPDSPISIGSLPVASDGHKVQRLLNRYFRIKYYGRT